jgi:hypothetical protein|tara:strand:- start:1509 stop:1832 length:324 start_codon:yes stop_codon:yes gene_type:complete
MADQLKYSTPLENTSPATTTTPRWQSTQLNNNQDRNSSVYIVDAKSPGTFKDLHDVTNNGTIIYRELEEYPEDCTVEQKSLKISFSRYHWKNREWRINIDSEFKELT